MNTTEFLPVQRTEDDIAPQVSQLSDGDLLGAFRGYNIRGVEATEQRQHGLASEYYHVADLYGSELSRRVEQRATQAHEATHGQSRIGRVINKILGVRVSES